MLILPHLRMTMDFGCFKLCGTVISVNPIKMNGTLAMFLELASPFLQLNKNKSDICV